MSAQTPNLLHDAPVPRLAGRPDRNDRYLRAAEVAELLSVKPDWVYRRVDQQRADCLPTTKLGRIVRFKASDIEAYLKSRGLDRQDILSSDDRNALTTPRGRMKVARECYQEGYLEKKESEVPGAISRLLSPAGRDSDNSTQG